MWEARDPPISANLFSRSAPPDHMRRLAAAAALLASAACSSAPGIGGAFNLVERLAGITVGERRTLTSFELSAFPRPSIDAITHEVERKPDAGGLRVYAVTSQAGLQRYSNEIAVDERGVIETHSFGPPLDDVYRRRR